MTIFKNVTHVIFDMDGLLIDSEKIYEQIISDIVGKYGKTYPAEIRQRVMGTSVRRCSEIIVADTPLPITVDEYIEQYRNLCLERMNNVKLLKGAEKLLRHLNASNIPFCLATSSSDIMVKKKNADKPELMSMFSHIVCGSTDPEVTNSKPAPDIFLIAASRFADKPKPEQCLVFEDSPNGVTAAVAAGMQVIMVPDARMPPELCSHATIALKSLEDFRPEDFGLPKF